jgi:hypothetical protein
MLIIGMSAYAEASEREKAMATGCDEFDAKSAHTRKAQIDASPTRQLLHLLRTAHGPSRPNFSLGPDVSFRGEAEVGRAAGFAATVENDPYATSLLVWVTLPWHAVISTDPIARTRQSIAQARTAISARRDASGTVCLCMGSGRALRLERR